MLNPGKELPSPERSPASPCPLPRPSKHKGFGHWQPLLWPLGISPLAPGLDLKSSSRGIHWPECCLHFSPKPQVPDGGRTVLSCMLSCVRFFVTFWTVACQVPLSMGFFRKECWGGLPFPPPGDPPDPRIEPTAPTLHADFFTHGAIGEAEASANSAWQGGGGQTISPLTLGSPTSGI